MVGSELTLNQFFGLVVITLIVWVSFNSSRIILIIEKAYNACFVDKFVFQRFLQYFIKI